MNTKTASQTYLREAIETAPPIKIIRMLYQGAIRALMQASAAGPHDGRFSERVSQADQIVTELRLALRPEFGQQQCEQLLELYVFVESRILEALKERTVEPLGEAQSVLQTLLDAWNQVELASGGEVA